jgi:hypothetical protein
MRNTGRAAKGAAQFKLIWTEDQITPNLRQVPRYLDRTIRTVMSYYEPQTENYAKKNAPWQDRTTNARNGLRAASGKEQDVHFIVLAHQVPYGIFLETRWAAKFAIIMPTIIEYGPRVMNTLGRILDKFK